MDRNPFDPRDIDLEGTEILGRNAEGSIIGRNIENRPSVTVSKSKDKLVFYIRTGKTLYFDKKGQEHKAEFRPKTNPYLLLKFLSKSPVETFTSEEIAKELRNPRRGGEDSTPDRRVRDTMEAVRKGLKLTEEDDFFIVDKGSFGLKCDVELRI